MKLSWLLSYVPLHKHQWQFKTKEVFLLHPVHKSTKTGGRKNATDILR